MNEPLESPCCKAKLVYDINRDRFVCLACQKEYDKPPAESPIDTKDPQ